MSLSNKNFVALKSLIIIATTQNQSVTLTTISEKTGVSVSYLEQLFAYLVAAGLVRSIRGPGGGYLLAKPRSAMSLNEIILAIDKRDKGERLKADIQDMKDKFHGMIADLNLEDFIKYS